MAFASTYSVAIQDSDAITAEHAAPFIYTFRELTPYLSDVTGFSDVHRMIAQKKTKAPDVFARARKAGTMLGQMNELGVPIPDKIRILKNHQAKVLRASSIPEYFTFRAIDYGSSATSVEFVSPGRLIPRGATLLVNQDGGVVAQFKVTNVSPASDGGATITWVNIAGTQAAITNTSTAKTTLLVAASAAEGGDVFAQDNQTASTETFGMTKIQTVISVTTESLVELYDTQDAVVVAADAFLSKADSVGKQINNTLLFAQAVTSTTDPDGNTYSIPAGLVNVSGIGSTSGTLGPTNLETIIDNIASVSSLDAEFERTSDGRIIIDCYCDRTRKLLFDNFMKTLAAPFNSSIFVNQGESMYDMHLNRYGGLSAVIRVQHDRSFDNSPYATTMLFLNKNTIAPMWLDQHFMRMEESKSDSDSNKYTTTITNKFGQVVKIKAHVQLLTGVTAIET